MIADIKGKISRCGSNLTENLEDNLTGNVFGALRYIPFNMAMKPILANAIYPRQMSNCIENINVEYWGNNIQFWPHNKKGELDVILEFYDLIIGIEVKFKSDISSDDAVDNSEEDVQKLDDSIKEQSINQLSRESEIINEKGIKKDKLLILIAPESRCASLYEDVTNRRIINGNVKLAYVSWQRFLYELSHLRIDDEFSMLIINDLKELLKKKGFEQFKDMRLEILNEVRTEDYFFFDYNPQFKFDFKTNIYIKGDLYYEFK